jgi:hypothetical protein
MFAAALVSMSAAARGANDPLLVVVESPRGSGLDPAAVRRSIERELVRKVLAPTDAAAARSSQVLLVAFDGRQIAMSLRTGDAAPTARTIPAPPEPATDLRAIAWLAGNLARDQVSPLLAAPAPALSTSPPPPPTPAPESASQPPPLAVTEPATESRSPPVESVRRAAAGTAVETSRWTVSGAGGPTGAAILGNRSWPAGTRYNGAAYQIEVQHQSSPGALLYGAVLQAGPVQHYLGVAGLLGSRWLRPRWYWEATFGLGLELMVLPTASYTYTNSSMTGPVSMTTVSSQTRPVLYARAVGTFGVPLNRSFDLLASLGLHVTSEEIDTGFGSVTIGLRLRIP